MIIFEILKRNIYIFFSDWLLTVGLIGNLVILIPLIVCRKEFPTNLILLAVFVSYSLSQI